MYILGAGETSMIETARSGQAYAMVCVFTYTEYFIAQGLASDIC